MVLKMLDSIYQIMQTIIIWHRVLMALLDNGRECNRAERVDDAASSIIIRMYLNVQPTHIMSIMWSCC